MLSDILKFLVMKGVAAVMSHSGLRVQVIGTAVAVPFPQKIFQGSLETKLLLT